METWKQIKGYEGFYEISDLGIVKKEPEYYHPVTGYKGTKSEMDAYIINREKS